MEPYRHELQADIGVKASGSVISNYVSPDIVKQAVKQLETVKPVSQAPRDINQTRVQPPIPALVQENLPKREPVVVSKRDFEKIEIKP